MIAFAEVSIGTGPRSPCVRCGSGVQRPEMRSADAVIAELTGVAERWERGPGPNVSFAGAEPFSHPELPRLVQGAVDAGIERIRLSTDAGALGVVGNAAGVVNAGVRHIEIVLLASGDTHDSLSGRPGLFAAARAGVAAFRTAADDAGVPVALSGRIPVCRHNAPHITDAVTALAKMGGLLAVLDPLGDALDPQLIAQAEQAAVVSGVWLHVPGVSSFPPPVSVEPVGS